MFKVLWLFTRMDVYTHGLPRHARQTSQVCDRWLGPAELQRPQVLLQNARITFHHSSFCVPQPCVTCWGCKPTAVVVVADFGCGFRARSLIYGLPLRLVRAMLHLLARVLRCRRLSPSRQRAKPDPPPRRIASVMCKALHRPCR